jgi:hypothetical protein
MILPSISINVTSTEISEEDDENSVRSPIFTRLLRLRFRLGFLEKLQMGRYFVRQLRPPVPIQAYPDTLSLNYLNMTKIEIGGKRPETQEWEKMVKIGGTYDWAWMNSQIIFEFDFVPPENTPRDIWIVRFDPPKLILKPNREDLNWLGAEDPFKTNVSIQLNPAADPKYTTQDVILKVNIIREEVLDKVGILRRLPSYFTKYREEYIEKQKELGIDYLWFDEPFERLKYNTFLRFTLYNKNRILPNYDRWVDSTVEILIRVNKYHQAEIVAPSPLKIRPYQVKSIPITIRNQGSHIDTFNFRVKCDDKSMVVTPPPVLTLKPGEEAKALVGIAAPRRFLSIGSTASIFIEAYSVDDPDTVFINTITLTTTGIHTTGGPTYNFVLLIITLFIIALILLYILRRRKEKISTKPDKPWNIPEEKEYLVKLREKDKKKYNETLKMMDEEYESALLWHRYYTIAKIKKKRRKKIQEEAKKRKEKLKMTEKISKGKKEEKARKEELKKEAKLKEEELKKEKKLSKEELKKEEKIKKEETRKVKEKEPIIPMKKEEKPAVIVDKQAELEKRKKEKALLRIKQEQEKQRRKLQV